MRSSPPAQQSSPRSTRFAAATSPQPIPLATDEFGVNDLPMTRDIDGVGSADREQPIKRGGPGRQVRIGVDTGVAGLLDKITGEDHGRAVFVVWGRRHHDQVCGGVAAARVGDRHDATSEIDDGVTDPALRWPQGRDRAVDLPGVRAVAQGVAAQVVGSRRQVFDNFGCAEDLCIGEPR